MAEAEALVADKERLAALNKNISALAIADSAERVAKLIIELLEK